MKTVDYIIVGQGIAGTMVAHAARKKGKSFLVIDKPDPNSATRTSAGLINPITGRKFVKSWMTDELLPAAFETYEELSELLKIPIYFPKHIIRAFKNSKDENNWEVRASVPGFQKYVENTTNLDIYKGIIKPAFGYGEVKGGGHIAPNELLDAYNDFLKKENLLLEEEFTYDAMTITSDHVIYKNIKARKVIFCEGLRIQQNPFFNYLPVRGNKGELLMIRIPNFEASKIIKQGLFLVPFGNETYWAGSNYIVEFEDDQPTKEGLEALIKKLDAILEVPYEVIRHRAAVRPTIPDIRPIIGEHPIFKNLVLFNGMGTKGASLSPYWSQQLILHLEEGALLRKEVNIKRYRKYLSEE